jgi:2-oxoglutarate ferredoxin oxidoreductase subunit alpha
MRAFPARPASAEASLPRPCDRSRVSLQRLGAHFASVIGSHQPVMRRTDAELLIVGFGGTYGHLHAAMDELRAQGKKVALAHFRYINPLPKNTAEVLRRYPKVVVAEQNMGQLAGWLRMKIDGFVPMQYNEVKGQPFKVSELVEAFSNLVKS